MFRGAGSARDVDGHVHQTGHGAVDASLRQGQVLQPWANGTFARPNGHADDGKQTTDGTIWVCKLGWWKDAPWDVRAYAEGHPTYPCDPTMQQLYGGAEFDAYHELGVSSMAAAVSARSGHFRSNSGELSRS